MQSLLMPIVILFILLATTFLVRLSLRMVEARQAAVICDRPTGRVRSLVVGPGCAWLIPWLERLLPYDLTLRTLHVAAYDVPTCDSFMVLASADLTFSLDAALMRAADLDQVLPFLDQPESGVRSWADHILRSLVGEFDEASLLRRRSQAQVALLLQQELQAAMTPLGVRIHAVRFLCRRDPRIMDAELAAQARALQWAKLAEVLGPGFDPSKILPYQALARLEGKDACVMAAFGLPADLSLALGTESLPVQWFLDTK